jgi:hypothetical protein
MSVDPLYLSGKYVLGHVSLTVKIDTYLLSTTPRSLPFARP